MELSEYDFCVVGGGIAGVSCIEQILELNSKARILLITASSVVKEASNVIKLTKTLQDFVIVQKSLKSFKDVHPSVQIVHDYVTALDHDHLTITTGSNGSYKYKKICICTGASPKTIFPENTIFRDRILSIRDTETVQKLISKTANARRILLVGNGGIATEFVYEVKGVDVIWAVKDGSISTNYFDSATAEWFIQFKLNKTETNCPGENDPATAGPSKRMRFTMSSAYDDGQGPSTSAGATMSNVGGIHGSALGPDWSEGLPLQGLLGSKNVSIEYEAECKRLLTPHEYEELVELNPELNLQRDEPNVDYPMYFELSNGVVKGCDFIVSAIGVKTVCPWFVGRCDREGGILVNRRMETTIPGIFGAGDIASTSGWPKFNHWFRMRLWTQARQMGLYAGKCMHLSLNDTKLFAQIEPDFCFQLFAHVTKFFGYKVVLLGLYNGQGLPPNELYVTIRCSKDVEFIKIVVHKCRLVGAILVGETGLEETFENLILNQLDISAFGEDLLNPGIDIDDYFD